MSEIAFADRLRMVIGDHKPTRWATDAGLSGATMHDWLKKGMQPYPKTLNRLVSYTGISAEWWLHGEGPPPVVSKDVTYPKSADSKPLVSGDDQATRLTLEHKPTRADNFALVPFYDVRASAGHGAFVTDQAATRHFAFDREWLTRQVGVAARRLALIPVSGTSMEPDLHDGDLVMIDRGDVEVLREGFYVFELDDRLFVKRLSLQGDRLVIESSNDGYPTSELNRLQENPGFRIHGRVIGSPSFKRF